MNSDLLRTFIEVAKTRHFGRAADNLFVTQSAVSFRIKQLEEALSGKLFVRQRNNLRLTQEGERFLKHAENLLSAWQVAVQDAGFGARTAQHIAIGSSSNLWDSFLRTSLPRLAKHFSACHFRTESDTEQELSRALLSGRLDLIILLDPPSLLELVVRELGVLDLVLVTSEPGMDVNTLNDMAHVEVNWGASGSFHHAALFTKNASPVLQTRQSQLALEYLLVNGGYAYLPRILVSDALSEKNLFEVSGAETLERPVYAVYAESSRQGEELESLSNYLADTVFNI